MMWVQVLCLALFFSVSIPRHMCCITMRKRQRQLLPQDTSIMLMQNQRIVRHTQATFITSLKLYNTAHSHCLETNNFTSS